MKVKLILLTISLVALVLVNIFIVFDSSQSQETVQAGQVFNSTQAYVLPFSEPSYFPILDASVEKPVISAKAGLVYDTRSGRYLYAKNPRIKLPIASLTKVMSAVVVVESLNLEDAVTVPKEVIRVDEERQGLYLGEQITVKNLLSLMLIESSNDAAYALANYANTQGVDFVGEMNRKAQTLGMTETNFLDPAGLNDDAYSTTEDLIKLVKYSMKYDLVWDILSEKSIVIKSVDGKIEHNIENTNQLLGIIPDIRGGKTGHTEKALGCLILAVEIPGKNDKLISVILGSNDRFGDTKKVIDWIKDSYRWD